MIRTAMDHTVDEECFRHFVTAVRELMQEGGEAPRWLLQGCGRMLSDYITHSSGLKYVLQGYLDGKLCMHCTIDTSNCIPFSLDFP